MAISIFDTHKFVRRLEAAGLTLEQAEAQAEVLTEAFTVNLEALVTKEYLESRLDVRFAEQQSYIDRRFAEQDAKFSKLFAELKAEMGSNQRVFVWTQAIVVSAVILPLLERLMAI